MSDLTSALQQVLDGRWAHIKAQSRTLAADTFMPDPDLDQEAHRRRVFEQMHALVAAGHARAAFRPEYGGTNDVGASVTAFEMLAHGDLSLLVKAGVHWGLFGGAVANLGTEVHHRTYLPSIIDFSLPGCFAMTETGHGSDVAALATTATFDAETDELVVDTPHPGARKDYIGGAARDGRLAVVFAQLVTGGQRHGVHAVLVPLRDEEGKALPGITIGECGRKAGLAGVDNGRLSFDQVRVPRENLLNRYGDIAPDGTYSSPIENETRRFFTMLGSLVRGRVSVAGAAGAATRTALTIAVRYGLDRRQFTTPGEAAEVTLMDYRTHQRRLLPALATSYALQLAQNDLVEQLHEVQTVLSEPGGVVDEGAQRLLESRAASIKVLATSHATRTIQECREACGGAGYLSENRLPQLKADTDVFTTFEGDNTVLLQLVAKGLLTGYRDSFGALDTVATVRFVARQLAATVVERTALRTLSQRLVDAAPGKDGDLRSRPVQMQLFVDRERHVLEGLARRLRPVARSADPFEGFNNTQDHLLRAARVHVDRVVLESFVAGIDRCEDEDARALLSKVADLHALSIVEADLAWFLAHGRLSPARAKAVIATVNALLAELRPHARSLVDAFGIPPAWLGASIATGIEAERQAAAGTDGSDATTAGTDADAVEESSAALAP